MLHYYGWGLFGGMGFLGAFVWFVLLIDLILLGVWLWQQVTKK